MPKVDECIYMIMKVWPHDGSLHLDAARGGSVRVATSFSEIKRRLPHTRGEEVFILRLNIVTQELDRIDCYPHKNRSGVPCWRTESEFDAYPYNYNMVTIP